MASLATIKLIISSKELPVWGYPEQYGEQKGCMCCSKMSPRSDRY
jgi:hypothetical protein